WCGPAACRRCGRASCPPRRPCRGSLPWRSTSLRTDRHDAAKRLPDPTSPRWAWQTVPMAQITLGGNPINTVGELPAVGSPAPGFTLTGTDLGPVSADQFRDKALLLNIFPSVD